MEPETTLERPPAPDPYAELRAALLGAIRNLRIATLALAVVLAGALGGITVYLVGRADEATRTHAALCAFRDDLVRRVATTQTFLIDHPRGIPGVPLATLQQSLKSQQSTIKALSRLECPPSPS